MASEIADPHLCIELCKKARPELLHDLHHGITIIAADPGSVLKIIKKNPKKITRPVLPRFLQQEIENPGIFYCRIGNFLFKNGKRHVSVIVFASVVFKGSGSAKSSCVCLGNRRKDVVCHSTGFLISGCVRRRCVRALQRLFQYKHKLRFEISLNFNVDTAMFHKAVENNVQPSHYFAQV